MIAHRFDGMNRRSFLRLAAIGGTGALVASSLAGCGKASPQISSAPAGSRSPNLDAIIDGARKEGELNLSWGESSGGGGRSVQSWAESINRNYGLKLNVQFTPGPSMSDMAARIVQEVAAGRPASSDVYFGSARATTTMVNQEVVQSVDWPSFATHLQKPDSLEATDLTVPVTADVPGISYNSNKVAPADVPKSLQDLLNPKYKGRMAGHVDASTYAEIASDEIWGEQRTVDFVRQFASSVAGLLRSGEIERVLTGEFDIFSVDGAGADVFRRQELGQPLGHVIPADVPMREFRCMCIPKNSAHPNAAKLFLDHVMSREGQDVLFANTYADHPSVHGSKFAPFIDKQVPGVTFHDLTVAFNQRNGVDKMDRLTRMFVAIMRGTKS